MPLTSTGRKIQTQWFYFAMVSKAARLSGMQNSPYGAALPLRYQARARTPR